MWGRTVYLPTPFGDVLALDAATGQERWRHEAHLDRGVSYLEGFTARGLTMWTDSSRGVNDRCRDVIFATSVDSKLRALDAHIGERCPSFGEGGILDLARAARRRDDSRSPRRHSQTSPPTVVNGVLVVGSTVDGHSESAQPTGVVLAFDARNGTLLWTFDAIPRTANHPTARDWSPTSAAV
jgi:quinoprotein glucose dehydrogenase